MMTTIHTPLPAATHVPSDDYSPEHLRMFAQLPNRVQVVSIPLDPKPISVGVGAFKGCLSSIEDLLRDI